MFRDWGPKTVDGVPFVLVDPQGDKVKNVIVLHSDNGTLAAKMPKSVTVPCNAPAKAIHLLERRRRLGVPATARRGRCR